MGDLYTKAGPGMEDFVATVVWDSTFIVLKEYVTLCNNI